jgi:formylglycine-generating enzyme required for sulfatase activity
MHAIRYSALSGLIALVVVLAIGLGACSSTTKKTTKKATSSPRGSKKPGTVKPGSFPSLEEAKVRAPWVKPMNYYEKVSIRPVFNKALKDRWPDGLEKEMDGELPIDPGVGPDVRIEESKEKEMVLIRAGSFPVGWDRTGAADAPQHQVSVDYDFYIDKTEVTNGHYYEFCVKTGHKRPTHWKFGDPAFNEEGWKKIENLPVVYISYDDALKYAEWRGKDIPTEEEWEKAARGAKAGNKFPWGLIFDKTKANTLHSWDNAEMAHLVEVARQKQNNAFEELYDMCGNAAEWTKSEYQPYPDPTGTSKYHDDAFFADEKHKVVRGGSFRTKSRGATTHYRLHEKPTTAERGDIGFRCVYRAK